MQRRLCTQLNKGSELGAQMWKDKAREFKNEGDPSKGQTLEPELHSHPMRFGSGGESLSVSKDPGQPSLAMGSLLLSPGSSLPYMALLDFLGMTPPLNRLRA